MGWLFYRKPANVKAELDSKLTWTNENGARKVLDSAIVNFRTYYAAVEHTLPTGVRQVWAAIFLLQFAGDEFGYKDMDETCGPYERQCPERILNLLTPTDHENALQWRWDCRAYHAQKADNKIVDGATVRFNAKWGGNLDTFIARKAPGGWRFQTLTGAGPYKLGGWRNRIAEVIPPGGKSTASKLEALGPRPKLAQELWDEAHADQFVSASAFGQWAAWVPAGKVGVVFRRKTDGAEQWALVPADAYNERDANATPRVRTGLIFNPARDEAIDRPANPHEQKAKAA